MEFNVELFDPKKHATIDIASAHLAVRQEQEANGENDFSNILDSQIELNAIEEFYLKEKGAFFVALHDGDLAGFIALKHLRDAPKVGEIKRLAIVKEFRGNGLAKELSAQAKRWATEQEFDHLLLRTNTGERATGIYEGLDFRYVGFVEDSKDYEMALPLASDSLQALLTLDGLPEAYSFQILTGQLNIPKGENPKDTIRAELGLSDSQPSPQGTPYRQADPPTQEKPSSTPEAQL